MYLYSRIDVSTQVIIQYVTSIKSTYYSGVEGPAGRARAGAGGNREATRRRVGRRVALIAFAHIANVVHVLLVAHIVHIAVPPQKVVSGDVP